jgi:hypothetical protein
MPAFDFGFDFRQTAAFVTDPAFCAPALTELYPHTYVNALGTSVVAGAVDPSAVQNFRDRSVLNDPRLAGQDGNNGNWFTPSFFQFQVALPSIGVWTLVAAFGDQEFASTEYITVFDNTTAIANYAGVAVNPNNYMDISGNIWAEAVFFASQVPIVYDFTSSILVIQIGPNTATGPVGGTNGSSIAHLRITQAGGGGGGSGGMNILWQGQHVNSMQNAGVY